MRKVTSTIDGRATWSDDAHPLPIINPHDESRNGVLLEADAVEVGIGRTGGFEGIHFFTETKTTSIATSAMELRKLGDH